LAVKEVLPHGQFLPWLRAEFGWAERTARYFMSVAERFGKSARVAELTIDSTAAYLLVAPSVPDESRQVAVERAEAGEHVTTSVAKEIVSDTKKKGQKKAKPVPAEKLGLQLAKVLEKYKQKWKPDDLAELARQLREFAAALDKPGRGTKKKAKD
jgi:hypothetical protein